MGYRCTVCGEPSIDLCPCEHFDWTIVPLSEVVIGDLLVRPLDGLRYKVDQVTQLRTESPWTEDIFEIVTAQHKSFTLIAGKLPVQVRRWTKCSWPRCQLHCGYCMKFAEDGGKTRRPINSK